MTPIESTRYVLTLIAAWRDGREGAQCSRPAPKRQS
jgi:hypothetical protein